MTFRQDIGRGSVNNEPWTGKRDAPNADGQSGPADPSMPPDERFGGQNTMIMDLDVWHSCGF